MYLFPSSVLSRPTEQIFLCCHGGLNEKSLEKEDEKWHKKKMRLIVRAGAEMLLETCSPKLGIKSV